MIQMQNITKYNCFILFSQGCPITEHILEKFLFNDVPISLCILNFFLDIIGTA